MTQSANNRWIFDFTRLENSPSKRDGIGAHEELLFRQKGTTLIRDMSQQLKLRPICMNTAIVYFHRFFTLRSFKRFDVYGIAVCSLFLSAKFEEQPIFKEHIIKLCFHCRHKALSDELYKKESERLVENENEMLLTFGFDLSVIHFQTVILDPGSTASDPTVINKNIQRNAYVIAGDLLRLTTISLQYTPNFAACICIYLSSTLLNLPISCSNWCQTIDPEIKLSDVEKEAQMFKCYINKTKLCAEEKKKKLMDASNSPESAYSSGSGNSPLFDDRPKSNVISTDSNKTIRKSNHSFGQIIANNNKRIRTEQSSSLGKCAVKSEANSLTYSHNSIKTKVLPNSTRSAVKTEITGLHANDETINRVKYQKVVKPNGEVVRVMSQQNNTSAQTTSNSAAKTASRLNSSSTVKKSAHTTPMIGNTLMCKKGYKNFKITFSTNDSMASDSNKRIVEPIVQNSTSIVKIES